MSYVNRFFISLKIIFVLFLSKNDHQYYNVSYIIPKSEGLPLYYVEDRPQFIRVDALADRHRSAFVRE